MKKYTNYTGVVFLLGLLFTGRVFAQQNLVMVKDINPGTGHAFNTAGAANVFFWKYGNKVIFPANNGQIGYELWTSDGTESGTHLIKDLNVGSTTSNLGVSATNFAYMGNDIIFQGGNLGGSGSGNYLVRTDGTTAGTSSIMSLNGLIAGTGVSGTLFQAGNTLFMVVSANSGFMTQLWKTDGTAAGTLMVKDINPTGTDEISQLITLNNMLLFSANDGVNGAELWKSDGTTAGTLMLKNIGPGSTTGYYGNTKAVAGNLLYFIANDGNGDELWRTDGTPAGTFMVKDINNNAAKGSAVYGLTAVDNQLFFLANDEVNGVELWKTDGTAAGTVMVKDITSGSASTTFGIMRALNGSLCFSANDGVNGSELWKSDGTAAGTVMVKDINPGSGSATPGNFSVLNGQLFITANDGTNGMELWVTDGTASGTQLLKDLTPGVDNSQFSAITGSDDWLFFLRTAPGTGVKELWKTNGTASATVPVYTTSTVNTYMIAGNTIYASVTSPANGREFYAGNVDAMLDQVITFDALPGKTYGDAPFAITATAFSGLPVTFSSSDETIAKIVNGNQVQILRAGTVTITAHQTGNVAYNAAPDATQQLVIAKAPLTITALDKNRVEGMPDPVFEVEYSGFVNGDDESDLTTPVSITTTATTGSAPGTYDIIPAGAASDNYTITYFKGGLTITAAPLTPQTITFNALPVKTAIDADFDPGATASSGLGVLYTSSNSAVATIVNNQVHITGTGTTTIRASQPGNDEYDIAPQVSQTLTVIRATQTITFDALPRKTYGEPDFNAGVTASSGLPVTYSSSDANVAVIENGLIRLTGYGTTTITASQVGDARYEAANATQELTVGKTQLTIKAEDRSRYQGQDNPVFTVLVEGFVNGDDIHDLATRVTFSTTATKTSAPGTYDIIVSGATSPQYDIVFVPGKLTINPVPVEKEAMDAWFSNSVSLQVHIYAKETQKAALQLLDVNGRLLIARELNLANGQNSYNIPVSNLPAGAYILYIKGTNLELDKKLLKR